MARAGYLALLGRANRAARQLAAGLLRAAPDARDCSPGCRSSPIGCVANLDASFGLVFSQPVLLALVQGGLCGTTPTGSCSATRCGRGTKVGFRRLVLDSRSGGQRGPRSRPAFDLQRSCAHRFASFGTCDSIEIERSVGAGDAGGLQHRRATPTSRQVAYEMPCGRLSLGDRDESSSIALMSMFASRRARLRGRGAPGPAAFVDRVCREQFSIDGCSRGDRFGRSLPAALGLVAAQRLEIVADDRLRCGPLQAQLCAHRSLALLASFCHIHSVELIRECNNLLSCSNCLLMEPIRLSVSGRSIRGVDCMEARSSPRPCAPPRCRSTTGWSRIRFAPISSVAGPSRADSLRGRSDPQRSQLCHPTRDRRQAIGAILNLEGSFQRPESAARVQSVEMPVVRVRTNCSRIRGRHVRSRLRPVDRVTGARRDGAGRVVAWMRVNTALGDPADRQSQLLHRCWLAYLSDDLPTDAVIRAHPLGRDESCRDSLFCASLDHTIWFHGRLSADRGICTTSPASTSSVAGGWRSATSSPTTGHTWPPWPRKCSCATPATGPEREIGADVALSATSAPNFRRGSLAAG